ncbi:MAG: hypothetical protein GWN62_16825 [Aliifodinibius sp.]|nr:hypothetical protein [Fodinibius sp.]
MSLYEPSLYFAEYLKLNWYDPVSGLIDNAVDIGTDMIFSNREVNANITEFEKYSPEVYETMEGKAAYQTRNQPRRWDFNVTLYKPQTFEKLRKIVSHIQNGYYVVATVLEGYQSYAGSDDFTQHVPGIAVINPGIVRFDQMAYRVMGRGHGTVRYTQISMSILESVNLSIPQQGGGGGGVLIGGGI